MNEVWTDGGGEITRRHALRVAVRNGLVMVCALLGENAAAAGPAWMTVGRVSEFRTGVPKRVTLKAGQAAFIVRQRNNRWLAVSARCTHKGVEIRWDAARSRFVCPAHQATFSADGKNPTSPAPNPLATFPTQATGSSVLVDAAKAAGAPPAVRRKGGERESGEHEDNDEHDEHGKRRSKDRRERKERHGDDDD